MEIIWSDDAKSDYDNNIKYLLEEWTEESAINFIDEVESILELLKTNPKLYPISDHIHRAVFSL